MIAYSGYGLGVDLRLPRPIGPYHYKQSLTY